MNNAILPTRNEAWGFFGTMASLEHELADAAEAWTLASRAIAANTGAAPEGVRDFLDSRYGRHFADEVANALAQGASLEQAIDAAVDRWMGWKISRQTSRETGIPAGLPQLTGFANHFAVLAEADA